MKFIYSSLGSSVFFLGIHCLTNQFNEQLSVFLLAQLAVRGGAAPVSQSGSGFESREAWNFVRLSFRNCISCVFDDCNDLLCILNCHHKLMLTIVFAHCVSTAKKMSKVQQFHQVRAGVKRVNFWRLRARRYGVFTSLKTVSTLESEVYLLILIAFNMMGGSYKFNH